LLRIYEKKKPTQKKKLKKNSLVARAALSSQGFRFWGLIPKPKIRILLKLVHLEASTKPHVHQKFEIFWTNVASTMAYPNFKNGPKTGLRPLGVKFVVHILLLHRSPYIVSTREFLKSTLIKSYMQFASDTDTLRNYTEKVIYRGTQNNVLLHVYSTTIIHIQN
jgi:hypothetical protein